MKRVIVYRDTILPKSETFIRQQIGALCNWQALLAGRDRAVNGLDIGGLKVLVEHDPLQSGLDRLKRRSFKRLGWPASVFYKHLKEYGAALAHVHFGTDAVTAWPWLKHFQMPVVVTLHGYDISIKPEVWELGQDLNMRRYPQRLREMASHDNVSFIAVSQAIRKMAIELYGLPAEKIKVLYIGVDEKTFSPGDSAVKISSKKILFVGRLVEKKGAAVLIRAMHLVLQQAPDCELLIVGDGPLRAELETLAKDLGVSARFMGMLQSHQIRNLMQDARIFCSPSVTAENGDSEGLGIVILEAQACGTPVVTSAVGGRDEGIDEGITGLAFAEADIGGLTSRLIRMLKDDDLIQRMSKAGPKFIAQRFSLTQCTERLEAHYDSLVSGATQGNPVNH